MVFSSETSGSLDEVTQQADSLVSCALCMGSGCICI